MLRQQRQPRRLHRLRRRRRRQPGNGSLIDLGAGNPIHLLNGNKFQREVDLAPLPGVLGLELVRYYNSAETRTGWLGRGWRLSYESELHLRPGGLEIAQPDGRRIAFTQSTQGPQQLDVYHPGSPMQGGVRAERKQEGTEYTWTWVDGRELRFNTRSAAPPRYTYAEINGRSLLDKTSMGRCPTAPRPTLRTPISRAMNRTRGQAPAQPHPSRRPHDQLRGGARQRAAAQVPPIRRAWPPLSDTASPTCPAPAKSSAQAGSRATRSSARAREPNP